MSKVQLVIKSFDKRIAESAGGFVVQYARELGMRASLVRLPAQVKRFQVLKAPHKYHKAWDAFQFTTHKRLITLKNMPVEHEAHLEHIKDQLPAGINLKITQTKPLHVPIPAHEGANFVSP